MHLRCDEMLNNSCFQIYCLFFDDVRNVSMAAMYSSLLFMNHAVYMKQANVTWRSQQSIPVSVVIIKIVRILRVMLWNDVRTTGGDVVRWWWLHSSCCSGSFW